MKAWQMHFLTSQMFIAGSFIAERRIDRIAMIFLGIVNLIGQIIVSNYEN